jgi:hypothetical protein
MEGLRLQPRGGSTHGVGLRADPGKSGSVSVWQADRELSETGAAGGVEREPTTAGTHHETRERAAAFPVGGSGASFGT